MKKEQPTHGGARKGAGRPSEGGRKVVTRSFSLSPEGLENITAKAAAKGCSASKLVDDWAKKLTSPEPMTTTKKQKVFRVETYIRSASGQHELIVTATSKKAAAEAFGVTLYELNSYGSETGNKEQIEAATAQAGVVLGRRLGSLGPYLPVGR